MQNWSTWVEFSSFGIQMRKTALGMLWDFPPSPDDSQNLPQMKKELRAVLVHFVCGVAWSRCRTCPCLGNNLNYLLQLQLWQVKLCVGFRRVYQDVTLPQILFSLRITICITQILINFFLWTDQLSTALLPQQIPATPWWTSRRQHIFGPFHGGGSDATLFGEGPWSSLAGNPSAEISQWAHSLQLSCTGTLVLWYPAWCYEFSPLYGF